MPFFESWSNGTAGAFICPRIFSAVSGINALRIVAPVWMESRRLYSTVARRSLSPPSRPNIQGSVSSIYLLHLLNRSKISVTASATRSLSIFAVTLETVSAVTFLRSASIPLSSSLFVFSTLPSKYLLLMEMVRLTRFPKVFASSEFQRSTISS